MHIVVTSHGSLCTGALEVVEMVAGKMPRICAVSLPFDDTGQFAGSLREAVEGRLEEGVLVLCDIVGGTPYNEALRLSLEHPDRVSVLANMNMPMLLEAGFALDAATSLDELRRIALEAGVESLRPLAQGGDLPSEGQEEDLF